MSDSPTGWPRKRVDEVCTVTRGASPRPIHEWISSSGTPWVKIADATADPSKFITKTKEFIRDEGRSRSVVVRPGDLILSNSATPGIPKFLAIEACIHDGWLLLRDLDGIDAMYFYYVFLGDRKALAGQGNGSIFTNLKTDIVKRHTLFVPPMKEQRAIAEVLGALDDKIAANTKLANNASSLVELEFHRLMKRTQRSVALGDLLTLEYGKALPATKRAPGSVRVYGSGGVVGTHTEALHQGPGVVVGRKGTAGAVHWSPAPFFPIDTTYWVRPLEDFVSPVFAYFLLKSLRLDEMNSDSAVPGLNRSEALAAPVLWPPSSELQSFTDEAMELLDVSAQMDRENVMLANTRDLLLPQLMSGKVRVKDAVTQVASLV
ncbi:restriction endonuclease subunit S [Arthrobacter subterraneus]|uniref:restriction endonuclease subunit S n=1 Tax=Arthrobacter subterraneus TaxID=335973 RepID=UPI003828EF58